MFDQGHSARFKILDMEAGTPAEWHICVFMYTYILIYIYAKLCVYIYTYSHKHMYTFRTHERTCI